MLGQTSILPDNPTVHVAGDAVGVPAPGETAPHLQRRWYIAFVGTNTEKHVRQRLQELGFDAYVASQSELRIWHNGRKNIVERVVIPTLVFVHVTERERRTIVNFPFIKSFLTDKAGRLNELGNHPLAVIPEIQMQTLQEMLANVDRTVQFATSGFALGDRVQVLGISGNPFTGHIVRLAGHKNRLVGIKLDFLGCAFIEVPTEKLLKLPN